MAALYNNILQLPERTLLTKKLTKAFFLNNFDLSAADKKVLNNVIQSMEWLACIKNETANIPIVKNNEYAYEEIQVMICAVQINELKDVAEKCINLFQKYIPYEVLLIVEDENDFIINACDKRINQKDADKRTIEKYFTTPVIPKIYKNEITASFFEALDFTQLDKTNMERTYKGYIQAIVQFQASSITGAFNKRTQVRTEEDMNNLQAIERLEKEIASLSNQAKKEDQLNSRVTLNIEIQKKRKLIEELKNKLIAL